MCWCSTVGYRVTVFCACYCNVSVQYSWVQGYCCVCVNVMCWCSRVEYRFTVVCVLLKCVGAVHLGKGLMLRVCYCNVLVQYSWIQGYCCVCVTAMC